MSRIGMLFRKLTPLDIMMADLEAAQMNRVLAAKELEYLKAMERLYIERIERLSSEIKAIRYARPSYRTECGSACPCSHSRLHCGGCSQCTILKHPTGGATL